MFKIHPVLGTDSQRKGNCKILTWGSQIPLLSKTWQITKWLIPLFMWWLIITCYQKQIYLFIDARKTHFFQWYAISPCLSALPWKMQSIPQEEALLCSAKYKSSFTLNCKPNLPRKYKQLDTLQKSKLIYIPFDNMSNQSCDCQVGWLLLSFYILN